MENRGASRHASGIRPNEMRSETEPINIELVSGEPCRLTRGPIVRGLDSAYIVIPAQ